jgi:small-conductance mechanosensitive channel
MSAQPLVWLRGSAAYSQPVQVFAGQYGSWRIAGQFSPCRFHFSPRSIRVSSLDHLVNNSGFAKLLLVFCCVLIFWMISKLLSRLARNYGSHRKQGELRVIYMTRLMNMGLMFCCIVVICLLLGLGYSEVSVFLSSIFAVVGVALFAQWSILSNITASLIIFFGFPYRVGDRIKILDKDDDISGTIEEITFFHVILRRDDDNLITYPNALILQKAVLKVDHPLPELAPPVADSEKTPT